MRVHLAPQAREDLDSIWSYVARESGSPNVATRVVTAVTSKFALFANSPHLGKILEMRTGVRTFSVDNYVIFYGVRSGEIRILRVLHTSRDAFTTFADE
jgi:plasmid stabilization system protein ParE